MSDEPVRRGWRGEAAGIPPARVLVPAAAAVLPMSTESSTAAASAAADAPDAVPTRGGVARASVPAPGARGAADAEDFPLWPTTTTVALHESAHTEADLGAGLGSDPEAVTAHAAGHAAAVDHLEGRAEVWPPPAMRAMRQPRDDRRSAPQRRVRQRRVRPARGPAAGLSAMLLIALLAGFFAWTSAEPFWLDMGHGERGTARITSCKGTGVLRRCLAEFTRPGLVEPVQGTRLVGLDEPAGASVAAEMVPGGRIAYAGNPTGLRVRWAAGLGLIVLCGIVLAWLTGAWRFARLRDRLTAWTLTAAAPLVLGAAIVLAAY
ncbi:hypothetical protein [Dactylosporangium sp. CS-033363]|uniref:hypothetical protein n=1 Tax=Dactylosporangium sp. CS-033363 TaxID=3239935 RepID=UPI003D90AEBB